MLLFPMQTLSYSVVLVHGYYICFENENNKSRQGIVFFAGTEYST